MLLFKRFDLFGISLFKFIEALLLGFHLRCQHLALYGDARDGRSHFG